MIQRATVKVDDLGYQLPIGNPSGRSFAFKPWKAKDERQIGDIRARNRSMSIGAFTTEVLAHFLTEWRGEDWEGKSQKEKKLALNTSYAADVHHAWIQLRREALGDVLPMTITCSGCAQKFEFRAELGTIDVSKIDEDDILETPFPLRDGLEYRGETRNAVTIAPIKWNVFERMKGGANIGKIKLQVLAGCIVGLNGVEGQVQIAPAMLDEMSKFVLESLSASLDSVQPGPDFRLEVECPHCGTENKE
mgnify:CR=1 FL=1